MSDKLRSLNRVIECTIVTLKIQRGYKLILNDDLKVSIMVWTFQSVLLNKENKIVSIKVSRKEDPEKIVIVKAKDIKIVHYKDRIKTWERVKSRNFVASIVNNTIRSFKRIIINSNCKNEGDDIDKEDSSVEVLKMYHTNEDVDTFYQENIK